MKDILIALLLLAAVVIAVLVFTGVTPGWWEQLDGTNHPRNSH